MMDVPTPKGRVTCLLRAGRAMIVFALFCRSCGWMIC
jgi:hypothetical protein